MLIQAEHGTIDPVHAAAWPLPPLWVTVPRSPPCAKSLLMWLLLTNQHHLLAPSFTSDRSERRLCLCLTAIMLFFRVRCCFQILETNWVCLIQRQTPKEVSATCSDWNALYDGSLLSGEHSCLVGFSDSLRASEPFDFWVPASVFHSWLLKCILLRLTARWFEVLPLHLVTITI